VVSRDASSSLLSDGDKGIEIVYGEEKKYFVLETVPFSVFSLVREILHIYEEFTGCGTVIQNTEA
jgi:hypothetical protein